MATDLETPDPQPNGRGSLPVVASATPAANTPTAAETAGSPSLTNTAQGRRLSEKSLIFVVGAVQFANILDFMMVMPLGPDYSRALGIPASQIGLIGAVYTGAAAVAGLAGMWWLERFDRRTALTVSMVGLGVGTLLGAFATGLNSLILARALAGFWGGPATSLSMSIIADVVPAERRGKAMGAVMGAFAAASVLGVPAGLELSRRGGWQMPFQAVAVLVFALAAAAWWALPKLRGHLDQGAVKVDPMSLLRRTKPQMALLATALLMASSFILVPNIAAYVQSNLGFPRDDLGGLYLLGGVISFFATRVAGRLADRFGISLISAIGALMVVAVTAVGFLGEQAYISVPLLFATLFLAMGMRNVPYNTLMTLVPGPQERATFMSLQSAAQHLAAAAGAYSSSRILEELPNHRLLGMNKVAALSIGLTVLALPVLWWLSRNVARRQPAAT